MALLLEISIEHEPWCKALPLLTLETDTTLTRVTDAVFQGKILKEEQTQICLTFISDATMAEYNAKFRGKKGSTNVLSFPFYDDPSSWYAIRGVPIILGECVFALETLFQEASCKNIPLYDYVVRMMIHSMLHIQGIHHGTEEQIQMMKKEEALIWASCYKQGLVTCNDIPYALAD